MTNHVDFFLILEPSSIVSLPAGVFMMIFKVFFPALTPGGNSGVEAKPKKPLFYHASFMNLPAISQGGFVDVFKVEAYGNIDLPVGQLPKIWFRI